VRSKWDLFDVRDDILVSLIMLITPIIFKCQCRCIRLHILALDGFLKDIFSFRKKNMGLYDLSASRSDFWEMIDIAESQSESRCYPLSQWLKDEGGLSHAASVWSSKDTIIYCFLNSVSGDPWLQATLWDIFFPQCDLQPSLNDGFM